MKVNRFDGTTQMVTKPIFFEVKSAFVRAFDVSRRLPVLVLFRVPVQVDLTAHTHKSTLVPIAVRSRPEQRPPESI